MILFSPPRPRHRQRNRIVQYVSIGICLLIFVSITPVGTPISDEIGGDFLDVSAPTPASVVMMDLMEEDDAPLSLASMHSEEPELPPIELTATATTKHKKKNGNFLTNILSRFNDNKNKKRRRKNGAKEEKNDAISSIMASKDIDILEENTGATATPATSSTPTYTSTSSSVATSIFACSVMALTYMLTTAVSVSTTSSTASPASTLTDMDAILMAAASTVSVTTTSPLHKVSILLTYLAKAVLMMVLLSLAALWYFLGLKISPSHMISVDPGKILQTLAAHGNRGATLDANAQRILQDFVKVTSCESAKLDLFRNRLEVVNFAVTPNRIRREGDNNEQLEEPILPALKIGKVQLEWDLYDSKPCFNIMVEDVHYLVEYTRNTPLVPLLSKSNWDELKEQGFPPEDDEDPPIQIGSINMKGHLTLSIRSRPFHTDLIKPIRIKLRSLGDLFDLIGSKSKEAQERGLAQSRAKAERVAAEELQQPSQPPSYSSLGGDAAEGEARFLAMNDQVGGEASSEAEAAIRGLSLSEFTTIVENYFKDRALGILTAPPKGVWHFWQQLFNNQKNNNKNNASTNDSISKQE